MITLTAATAKIIIFLDLSLLLSPLEALVALVLSDEELDRTKPNSESQGHPSRAQGTAKCAQAIVPVSDDFICWQATSPVMQHLSHQVILC